MNRTLPAIAAMSLLVVPLTACGGGSSGTATKTVTAPASSPSSASTPYGSDPSFAITDTQYLAKMRANTGDDGSDEQLRNIGKSVCNDLRNAGTPVEDEIRALYGTNGYTDAQVSFLVATAARAYCATPGIESQVRALSK